MSSTRIKDLSLRPTSVGGDQIIQNLTQAGQSDGINPISLDHKFYGISQDGEVFTLATMTVSESGTNTQTGALGFSLSDGTGESVSVLDINSDGLSVAGGITVVGGNTVFETSTIEVADKDLVLASGAETLTDLHNGGIILGTEQSTEVKILYESILNQWNSNVGVNIDPGQAFTVGEDITRLDEIGLKIGDVSLTSGSLTLSQDVSLNTLGLEIGDISLSSQNGLEIGPDITMNTDGIRLGSSDPVIIDQNGISIGSEFSINVETGLSFGEGLSLTAENGLQIGDDISLTIEDGLRIDDILLSDSGLAIGGVDPITLDQNGLSFTDLNLSTSTGLSISDNVVLNSESLTIGPHEDVKLDNNGVSLGSFGEFTKTNGLTLGTSTHISSESVTLGETEPTTIDDTSISLGSDILLNHDGLYLTNEDACVFMGGTTWKIAYDSSTQNLLFQFYDSVSSEYITKMEIKNSS